MKDIKDYIHLYIGCECMIGDLNWKPETNLHGLAPGSDPNYGKPIRTKVSAHVISAFLHKTTLILRRLSSISDDEVKDLFQYEKIKSMYREIIFERQMWNDVLTGITISYLTGSDEDGWHPQSWTLEFSAMNANDFVWFLSKGFDLFQLIDSNLAIDSSTITENK